MDFHIFWFISFLSQIYFQIQFRTKKAKIYFFFLLDIKNLQQSFLRGDSEISPEKIEEKKRWKRIFVKIKQGFLTIFTIFQSTKLHGRFENTKYCRSWSMKSVLKLESFVSLQFGLLSHLLWTFESTVLGKQFDTKNVFGYQRKILKLSFDRFYSWSIFFLHNAT